MTMVLDAKKPNFESPEWLWFLVWFIMALHYKMQHVLKQNETAILLQNAKKVYYKTRQDFYYKIQQLLQKATFITKCVGTIGIKSIECCPAFWTRLLQETVTNFCHVLFMSSYATVINRSARLTP